ncbi:hypothetical protein JCM8547_001740 [Rhodosporidiobolus lusitaniae]
MRFSLLPLLSLATLATAQSSTTSSLVPDQTATPGSALTNAYWLIYTNDVRDYLWLSTIPKSTTELVQEATAWGEQCIYGYRDAVDEYTQAVGFYEGDEDAQVRDVIKAVTGLWKVDGSADAYMSAETIAAQGCYTQYCSSVALGNGADLPVLNNGSAWIAGQSLESWFGQSVSFGKEETRLLTADEVASSSAISTTSSPVPSLSSSASSSSFAFSVASSLFNAAESTTSSTSSLSSSRSSTPEPASSCCVAPLSPSFNSFDAGLSTTSALSASPSSLFSSFRLNGKPSSSLLRPEQFPRLFHLSSSIASRRTFAFALPAIAATDPFSSLLPPSRE